MLKYLIPSALLFATACASPPHIGKEILPASPEKAEASPPIQGGLVQPVPVEAKSESSPAVSDSRASHLRKAPTPNAKDWESAESIPVREKTCDVRRIDSFVRVKCEGGNRVEQLVGDVKTVSFGCFNDGDPKCAVFRVEPGERRVVQFSDASFSEGGGWGGANLSLTKVALVSAWWPKGATEPKIIVD